MSLIGSLTSGVSAMNAFTKDLEVIGNNISNVNTVGYKGASVSFADSFSNTLKASVQVGTGVQIADVATNFSQGSLSSTGLTTDLGISGNGFFLVKDPTTLATFATRAGDFKIDDSGYLTTYQGARVQGYNAASGTVGDIKLATPPTGTELSSYSIGTDGSLTEFYSDGSTAVTNQVLLQNYSNPNALTKEGSNLYTNLSAAGIIGTDPMTVASNTPGGTGLGKIQSGTLEQANVDLTDEFANMITAQRSFQASSRLITVSDTVLEDVVNLKR